MTRDGEVVLRSYDSYREAADARNGWCDLLGFYALADSLGVRVTRRRGYRSWVVVLARHDRDAVPATVFHMDSHDRASACHAYYD